MFSYLLWNEEDSMLNGRSWWWCFLLIGWLMIVSSYQQKLGNPNVSRLLSKLFWSVKSSHLGTLAKGLFPCPGGVWFLEDCVSAHILSLREQGTRIQAHSLYWIFTVVPASPPHFPNNENSSSNLTLCMAREKARRGHWVTPSHHVLLWLKALLPPPPSLNCIWEEVQTISILSHPLIKPFRGTGPRDSVRVSGLIPPFNMEEARQVVVFHGQCCCEGGTNSPLPSRFLLLL